MSKIVIIGTSHKYQIGRVKAETIEHFKNLLRSLCSEYGIAALAEEMNQTALAEAGVSESVVCVVASELELKHQLSDPPPEIRKELGVHSENDICVQGFLNDWTHEQIAAEIRKSHDIRERYWLAQLRTLDSWPLLFVCGANHSESFFWLLRNSGFEAIVSFSDWEPNE